MAPPSEIIGIFQGDLIIKTAIQAAIEDMRANDWLLDHAFASLPNDTLTSGEYGVKEIEKAKQWFRNTPIKVVMSTSIDTPDFPVITISQGDVLEAETTLADTHYVPQQDDDRTWPALTDPFQATAGAVSGQLVIPDSVTLVLAPGMQVIDRAGVAHEILTIEDTYITVANPPGDWSRCVIKGKAPATVTHIGSVVHKETYSLGCHVQGEQINLTYLHSVLVFILYRYKKRLFEARGFERHTVGSSDFRRNEAFENELTFSRHITLTGFVRQAWPADEYDKVTAVQTTLIVSGAGQQPNPEELSWMGEEDALLIGLK